jgi:hypothetical protein
MKSNKDIKQRIINAGYEAVEQLIKVAKEDIIKRNIDEDEFLELAADKLKNAAATKKLAIFDAFEILSRIEAETENLELPAEEGKGQKKQGFAERNSRS